MTQKGGRIEAALRSLYGEKWRQGLLVHVLIGLGRKLMMKSPSRDLLLEKQVERQDEYLDSDEAAAKELEDNPMAYVRLINGELARELETQIRAIRDGPVKNALDKTYPDLGELIEAIGIQARLRLEGKGNHELARLLENVVQVTWEDASPTVREDTLRILRLLGFLTSTIAP